MTIKVYPGAKRPSHQVSLSDGVRTYGLRLADGPESLEEAPLTPSTVHFSGGGTKFGDWEPGMSHIEQRTWEGGRGNDSFVDDPTRFYDSKMAWTLTPGKLLPAPAWKFSNGYVSEVNQQLPGDMAWRQLYEDYEDIAEGFSHSGGWSGLDTVYLWVRRVGNPGTLTVKIQLDSSGAPGTVMDSDTLTASDVNENEMALAAFDLSGTGALVGTESWLGIYGNTSDDAANHWEIGVDIDGGNAWYHYQKSSWQAADFSIYYRVSSAVADRKFHLFEYQGALYAVDQQADGTSAKLYINGDRGKATSGGSTSLTDTDKSWTADEWIGAWVKITAGTGVGQSRQITDNTATALTVAAWDISPSTDSEYVICHTDIWQDISPASGDQFDAACTCVGMIDEQVNFGVYKKPALKMRWNAGASPPAHEFDDNTAGTPYDDVIVTTDETNGVQLYRVRNAIGTAVYIQRASKAAWLTDYTFGTQVAVGSNSLPITGVAFHDGKLIAFKPDGAYQINTDDTAKKIIGDIGFIKSENNGEAVLSHGLYLYFSWGGYAIQRMYDSSGNYDLTNIGPDQDAGLPDDRKGKCVAMIGTPPGIMAAIQSDGYSSVLVLPTDGFGWHEVFRGWASGVKIDNMYMQDIHNRGR